MADYVTPFLRPLDVGAPQNAASGRDSCAAKFDLKGRWGHGGDRDA